jgi:hypothetical protein
MTSWLLADDRSQFHSEEIASLPGAIAGHSQ